LLVATQEAEEGLHRLAHRPGDSALVHAAAGGLHEGLREAFAAIGHRRAQHPGLRHCAQHTFADALHHFGGTQALFETGRSDQHCEAGTAWIEVHFVLHQKLCAMSH
jgi:hypothetical protein